MKESVLTEIKENRKFLLKWIKALRSGEYDQGNSNLYHYLNDEYCCLGVACHLLDIFNDKLNMLEYPHQIGGEHLDLLPTVIVESHWEKFFANLNDGHVYSTKTSPDSLEEFAVEMCRIFNIGKEQDGLIRLGMHTFEEIADIIEKIANYETTE